MLSVKPSTSRRSRHLLIALGFLAPNILGFVVFTALPLLFALVLAFTNWDLSLHNRFKPDTPIRFVGLDNFIRLLRDDDFYRYLGNTLFLMFGLPISIAASLGAALLLSRDLGRTTWRLWRGLIVGALLVAGSLFLAAVGLGGSAMTILLSSLAGLILLGGVLGGNAVYRTLFYLPHFTAGVATMLLWKKLYNPTSGPFTAALTPVLEGLESLVRSTPASGWQSLAILVLVGALGLAVWGIRHGVRLWRDREFTLGGTSLLVIGWAGAMLILLGLAHVIFHLPSWVDQGGLQPPKWLDDPHWAKPSLIFMGLWMAIGSNTMLLYLAALTNVPGELYEAANLDGASPLQKFWHVTWPQLAPTTFFVVIIGVIGGLQGGFDMARVMTQGGPAGQTTTLAYYIYLEGFETGRLGFSSAIAWTLFLLVLLVTLFNWKFGNRYVND